MDIPQLRKIINWLGTGSINIFGLPFAGKDTHGRKLAELLNAPLIGGGEIIRSSAAKPLKDHVAQGLLAPTEEFLDAILPFLSQNEFRGHPLILNSVGRWFGEHEVVQQAAQEAGHPIKVVLFIDISLDELYRRWESAKQIGDRGNRHDDAKQIIGTRINEFEVKTLPVVEYFQDTQLLLSVNGSGTMDETFQKILGALEKYIDESTGF